jgi:hypothetical protein
VQLEYAFRRFTPAGVPFAAISLHQVGDRPPGAVVGAAMVDAQLT